MPDVTARIQLNRRCIRTNFYRLYFVVALNALGLAGLLQLDFVGINILFLFMSRLGLLLSVQKYAQS